MLQRFANLLEGDLHAADGLRTNAIHVRGQRNRRCAYIAVLAERFPRALLAFRRDDVDVRRRGHTRAALDLDEVLALQELEDGLEDLRER